MDYLIRLSIALGAILSVYVNTFLFDLPIGLFAIVYTLVVAALIAKPGIIDKNGRPVINYCKKCGRAYPGSYHRCK